MKLEKNVTTSENEEVAKNVVAEEEAVSESEETTEEDIDDPEMYEQKVQKWKEEYGKIYLSVFDEVELVWHKLNRKIYNEIMTAVEENKENVTEDMVIEERQLLVIKRCTIHPSQKEIDEILEDYPGILTSLSAEILKRSGFSRPLTVEV